MEDLNIYNPEDCWDIVISAQDKPLVTINAETGEVTLHGDYEKTANEAAKVFWEALRMNRKKFVMVDDKGE